MHVLAGAALVATSFFVIAFIEGLILVALGLLALRFWPTLPHRVKVAALAVLMFAFAPMMANAADSAAVVIPWGDWLSQILTEIALAAGTIAVLLVTWALRFLPATLKAYVTKQMIERAEQLLAVAIANGSNSVAGVVKGQTLNVDLGSQVAAQALQYAVDHGPGQLIDWMGGADKVLEKIIARLPLSAEATSTDVFDKINIIPSPPNPPKV